jgi:hypothetical protein
VGALPVPNTVAFVKLRCFKSFGRQTPLSYLRIREVLVRFVHIDRAISIKNVCRVIHLILGRVNHDQASAASDRFRVLARMRFRDSVALESTCDASSGGSEPGPHYACRQRSCRQHRTDAWYMPAMNPANPPIAAPVPAVVSPPNSSIGPRLGVSALDAATVPGATTLRLSRENPSVMRS